MSRQSFNSASSSRLQHASSQPQPVRPHPLAPYHPPADTATYRDLLLFEERLKSNAEMLRRRRQRYNIFLWSFVTSLFTMGYRLLMQPPTSPLKLRALQASVAVLFITLALFFASGMYQEKIRYAHSYINHSNKALRPLNMHLNMRRPKTAFLSYIPFLPLSFISSTTKAPQASSSTPPLATAPAPISGKPFLGGKGSASSSSGLGSNRKVSGTPNVMATIPPSSNPRGELIFSSRVDKAFREGYERYRAAFERRREERAKEESRRNAKNWYLPFGSSSKQQRSASPSPGPGMGRLTPTPTPPLSRKETPPPGSLAATTSTSNLNPSAARRRSPSPGRSSLRHSISSALHEGLAQQDLAAVTTTGGIPLSGQAVGKGVGILKDNRERSESYSFVLNQRQPSDAGFGTLPRRG
ncbi:hypothetical protein IAU59_002859 [Kwoniella sp. CBS 9459]